MNRLAEDGRASVDSAGSRFVDPETERLASLSASLLDIQQTRKALDQRGQLMLAADLKAIEDRTARHLSKALREHPLWPWLSQFTGLGGAHTARLLARIGNPLRFPGRTCGKGHYVSEEIAEGRPCPALGRDDESCPGVIGPVRPGTGTRSLWHYLGLHAVDGRSPRRTKGQRADWDPIGRASVLQPDGIADHIVRHRTPIYRDIYDQTKDRLTKTRGVDVSSASEGANGAERAHEIVTVFGAEAEGAVRGIASACGDGPLRPFQLDAIARKVAAKAFVADLLHEWKRLARVDASGVPGIDLGPSDAMKGAINRAA